MPFGRVISPPYDFIMSDLNGKIDMIIFNDGDPRNEGWLEQARKRGGKVKMVARGDVARRTGLHCGADWQWPEARGLNGYELIRQTTQ